MSNKRPLDLDSLADQLAKSTHAKWAAYFPALPNPTFHLSVFTDLMRHILSSRKAALGAERFQRLLGAYLSDVQGFLDAYAEALATRHGEQISTYAAIEFFGVFHANRAWMRYIGLLGSGEVEPGIPDPMSDAFPTTAICDPYKAARNG
jgi:hypothetical protein